MEKLDPVPACFSGVQFLPVERLERIVLEKLQKFERHKGTPVAFPIPIEDMIEEVEKIPIEAFEGSAQFPLDVLGAYDFKRKVMFVREDIEHAGRKRFTQAHEYGHFVLHSPHFIQQVFDFYAEDEPGEIQLLRSGERTRNILEWQANQFASHFLMPTHLIKAALGVLRHDALEDDLQRLLSEQANVSLQAASIRLKNFRWN